MWNEGDPNFRGILVKAETSISSAVNSLSSWLWTLERILNMHCTGMCTQKHTDCADMGLKADIWLWKGVITQQCILSACYTWEDAHRIIKMGSDVCVWGCWEQQRQIPEGSTGWFHHCVWATLLITGLLCLPQVFPPVCRSRNSNLSKEPVLVLQDGTNTDWREWSWFLPCALDLKIIFPGIWEMMQEEEKQSRGSPVTWGACVMLPASLGKENIPCASQSRLRLGAGARSSQHITQPYSCNPSLSGFHPGSFWITALRCQALAGAASKGCLSCGVFCPWLSSLWLPAPKSYFEFLVSPVSCYSDYLGHYYLSYLIFGIFLHMLQH